MIQMLLYFSYLVYEVETVNLIYQPIVLHIYLFVHAMTC